MYPTFSPSSIGGRSENSIEKPSLQLPATSHPEWDGLIRRRWSIIFAVVALVQATICLAFEIYIYVRFQWSLNPQFQSNFEKQIEVIPIFLPLFVFIFCYENVVVWDALIAQNTIQVIGVCISNLVLAVYTSIQAEQIKESLQVMESSGALRQGQTANLLLADTQAFLIAIPCIMALATIFMAFCTWKVYQEFAWTILKLVGADYPMKQRYVYYQVYITLLKFDFFFVVGFLIQLVGVVTKKWDPEFGLTIAAIPVTIAILIAAGYSTHYEKKWGMVATMFLYLGALIYFIFKLARLFSNDWQFYYRAVKMPLATFAIVAISLIIATFFNALICTLNFGQGLKEQFGARRASNASGSSDPASLEEGNRRMTIH
ncbi:unnamed protein product [Clonostachys byssicola]|uniref:Uncharacterized protein n=1 Tax=Clonostachys byssicola TaxID=160290 RepID=A0A9N9UDF4_9HYPO|nr:unnamed protein product [Clonostachys byssicola]